MLGSRMGKTKGCRRSSGSFIKTIIVQDLRIPPGAGVHVEAHIINRSIVSIKCHIIPRPQSNVFKLLLLSNQLSKTQRLCISDKEKEQIFTFEKLEPADV